MGLAGPSGLERVELTGAGSAQKKRLDVDFLIYRKKLFQCETITRKPIENVSKLEKYRENSQNSRKIPRDRLEHEQSK
jgi:hypothetical protein